MRSEKQVGGKTPAAPDLGAGSGAGLGVTPALYISRYVNRHVIADARKAKMLMEYAAMSMQAAREAFEQGDYEQAEFCRGLARFCLDMSADYQARYIGEKRWW
jgi:hypothetical protein